MLYFMTLHVQSYAMQTEVSQISRAFLIFDDVVPHMPKDSGAGQCTEAVECQVWRRHAKLMGKV
jgi:hypothetical protein